MAFGPEAHADAISYEVIIDHASTGVRATIQVGMGLIVGGVASEALRDQVFQAFLTRVSGMPGATLQSAVKTGSFNASVTP